MEIKKLDKSQVVSFDTEYINDSRWGIIKRCIDAHIAKEHFSFLDIGGGNGLFADRLLEHFPGAEGTILDNSELLI